jgi:hypothetical protein
MSTQFLVACPVVLFFALLAPDIGRTVSWTLVGIAAVLGLATFGALLLTGCKDPGIISRNDAASIPDMCATLIQIRPCLCHAAVYGMQL